VGTDANSTKGAGSRLECTGTITILTPWSFSSSAETLDWYKSARRPSVKTTIVEPAPSRPRCKNAALAAPNPMAKSVAPRSHSSFSAPFSNSSTSSVSGTTMRASPEKEIKPTRGPMSDVVGAYIRPKCLARSFKLLKPVSDREPLLSTTMRMSSLAVHFSGP